VSIKRMPKGGGAVEHVADIDEGFVGFHLTRTDVVWSNYERTTPGGIHRVAKFAGQGQPTTLVTRPYPYGLAVDDEHVYWTETDRGWSSEDSPGSSTVWSATLAGGPPMLLASTVGGLGATFDVMRAGHTLYLTNHRMIQALPTTGGAPRPVLTDVDYAGYFATEEATLFFTRTSSGGDGSPVEALTVP
jgi:hypothetical protein